MVRNLTLSIAICLLLCGPLLFAVSEANGWCDIPSWLSTEDADYLVGKKEPAKVGDYASLSGFVSEDLQQEVEIFVDQHIPAKGNALLVNAGAQFEAIELSNAFFNWCCVPTFYGSDFVLVVNDGERRLLQVPEKLMSETMSRYHDTALKYNALAARYPNIRFFAYMVPDPQNASDSPSSKLVSNPLTYTQAREALMVETPIYSWISGDVTYEEFTQGWYRTDHHWNMDGALGAYNRIVVVLGLNDPVVPSALLDYEKPTSYGSLARRALYDHIGDYIIDYQFALPDFNVVVSGTQGSSEELTHIDLYREGDWESNQYTNRYREYFHGDFGLIEIENPDAKVDDELLIVGDSYTNCIERLLASHFAKTYVFDPRYTMQSLDEFITEHPQIDDVIFIMQAINFVHSATNKALG